MQQASQCLRAGGVVAYPTEAVWGLGCDPGNQAAVQRVLELKQRPEEKGLILVAANTEQITELLQPLSPQQKETLEVSWPGPVTWLIPDLENVFPPWIKGEHTSVAVRVSAHPVVRALCLAFGGPLVSTSANKAGEPEIKSRSRIDQQFGSTIDFVVAGELGDAARPSEIRDLVTGAVLR